MRRAHASRRLAGWIKRLIVLELFAGRFLINKTLRRRDGQIVDAKSVAADPPPTIVFGVIGAGDGSDERHKTLDRRDNWMRNMKSNRLPLGVEHKVRLAIAHRPFLAGRLRESLPHPISRRFLRHKCYRRLGGSLQNGSHYTTDQSADRDFGQYLSAFQLVMSKKESRRSSCPEWRLSSSLCHSYRGVTPQLIGCGRRHWSNLNKLAARAPVNRLLGGFRCIRIAKIFSEASSIPFDRKFLYKLSRFIIAIQSIRISPTPSIELHSHSLAVYF